ncbi:hypothetical protein [Streptomyces pseudovenezuelae]
MYDIVAIVLPATITAVGTIIGAIVTAKSNRRDGQQAPPDSES